MPTIQEVLAAQIQTNQQQLAAYQADINNLLNMIQTLNDNTRTMQAWLAVNLV